MKSQIKKIISIFACICLLLSAMVITASAAETSATISFATTDARVSQDADSQVWSANGITVTNNKGASTSNVADYYNPVRFYKNSDVVIEYSGMTKIEINVSGIPAKNQNAWVNSCSDATISGDIVTITLAAPADSYSITLTDNQARANSITVYAGAASETPVVIPEKTIAEVLAMEDSDDKFYVTAEIVDTYGSKWATYGNFILKDSSTDETIIMYGLDDEAGNRYDAMETKPVVGDTVKVLANRSSYNGVGQLANAVLIEYTPAPQKKTIAEVLAMEDGDTKFYVTAEIVDTYRDTWATYGNFILKDDSTDETIIMYGLNDEAGNRYDAMETKPVVGDTVKVLANRSSYNGVGQLANAVLVELTPATPDEGGEDVTPPTDDEDEETPETPATTLEVVDAPVAGTAYKFGMVQGNLENAVYYLAGGMDGYYMATTTDADAAIEVYLEETEGGYYLYTMVDGAKTYINMVVSGTHVNGAYEATASTVYTYDAENKTIVATVNEELYWFATRNDDTYTTLGPAKVSYAGFYGQFYAEPVVDDGDDTDAPTTDGDENDTTTGGTTTGGTTTTPETKPNTDNSTTSPDTGDNVGAFAVMAIAAAAVVLYTSKKRV